MSTYVISDIHGCNKTFRKALKSIGLKKRDTLILLGDLIDRGADSKGVLDTIFLLLDHNFNIISIKGNHEQMLIDSLNDVTWHVNWMKNGGKQTLNSFLTSEIKRIPQKYFDYLRSMKSHYILNDNIFVHAGINMNIEEPFKDEYSLLWLRDWEKEFNQEWLGKRKVIHGHSPMTKEKILNQFINREQVLCIDNGGYMMNSDEFGSLCVLKLDDFTLHFEKNIDNESN